MLTWFKLLGYASAIMELFKIEWTMPCSLDDADKYAPNYSAGVYAVCVTDGKTAKRFQYIEQTSDILQRTRQHKQGWAQGLTQSEINRRVISFGTISPLELNPNEPPEKFRKDVENILLYTIKPPGEHSWASKSYRGRPIIIINCGKLILIDRIMSSSHVALELLSKKRSIPTKKHESRKDKGLFSRIQIS